MREAPRPALPVHPVPHRAGLFSRWGQGWLRPTAPGALPDDGFRPVVFVPGSAQSTFALMRTWFRFHARSRTYVVAYHADPSRLAAAVGRTLAEVVRLNGLSPEATVDVVAHGMGGIAVRLAMADPSCADRIATLVTLGTPHGGTQAGDFRPHSPLHRRLQGQLPWRGPRMVCLWSPDDRRILPATSARVEGAENYEMPGFVRHSYLMRPASWRRVLDVL